MKVYIASKYIEHKELNNNIYTALAKAGINAFLPKSINIDALTKDEMYTVAEICYDEIERCDVILVVCPFGKSVSSEFGYAIALKRVCQAKKRIVAMNLDFFDEAMIYPYVDKTVNSILELITYLKEFAE